MIEKKWTTPWATAVVGILYSLLLITGFVLIWISVPIDPNEVVYWQPENSRNVTLALNLLPIGGIAFLWFIGVAQIHIGSNEAPLLVNHRQTRAES